MKAIKLTVASLLIASTAHATEVHNVEKAPSYFGILVNAWETGDFQSVHSNSSFVADVKQTSADAQDTTFITTGWCNEAIVWAMVEAGMFDQAKVSSAASWSQTMLGRDWTSHYNNKVIGSWNHNSNFNWEDVPNRICCCS